MAKPPRRCSVIYSGNIDRATCLFEELIKRFCVLEDKTTELFDEQAQFESAIQTRIYRIYDGKIPTAHCIKFIYDTRDKEKTIFGIKYNVSCNVESRKFIDREMPNMIERSRVLCENSGVER